MSDEDNSELTSRDQAEQQTSDTNEFDIEPEILKDAPPEVQRIVRSMSMTRFGSMPNPLTEKINEKHIDKILDLSDKDDERKLNDVTQSRRYGFAYVALFAAVFIFLTIFLANSNSPLYQELLKIIAIFAGGFGSGFGIKGYIDKDK